MYSHIPDVVAAHVHEGEGTKTEQKTKRLYSFVRRLLWHGFMASFAFACLVFGLYICSFYIQTLVRNELDAWEVPGPGLYRKDHWDANWALGAHFVGGAYLMVLGPLQFVPAIRRKCMTLHRWNGRLAFVGAMLTALGGMYYIGSVGSANVPVVGQSANWNNLLFGTTMLICGIQTYRHAAFTKRIDQVRARNFGVGFPSSSTAMPNITMTMSQQSSCSINSGLMEWQRSVLVVSMSALGNGR